MPSHQVVPLDGGTPVPESQWSPATRTAGNGMRLSRRSHGRVREKLSGALGRDRPPTSQPTGRDERAKPTHRASFFVEKLRTEGVSTAGPASTALLTPDSGGSRFAK